MAKLNPKPFFVLAVVVVIAIGGYFILGGDVKEEEQYYDFASCLTENKVTKYGFDACPNCQKQKHIIGVDAFKQNIDDAGLYVRCRPEEEATKPIGDNLDKISILSEYQDKVTAETTHGELCALMVGTGTPTWVYNDKQVEGWQTIPELAEFSGCPLPEGFE